MAKTINISDKFSNEKSKIVIGQDVYFVNDGVQTVLKIQELSNKGDVLSIISAIEVALGKEACEKLNLRELSMKNLQVLFTGINAAMLDLEYDEVTQRFPENE